ncbi:MAG TPA: alanine racemase [Spirochaetota bacterium]|nr:alanine racemase [Spirochaetota bacterium]
MDMIETYQNRPTRAVISLPALRNNFRIVKESVRPGVKIMAAVKANAYGHGILRISQELLSLGVDALAVAVLEEAVYLRRSGISAPILVLGAINVDQIQGFIEHDVEITCSSVDKARAISDAAKSMHKDAVVHLKIDTGMERIGVQWTNAARFIDEVYSLPNIRVKGIFSHFAKADTDRDFTIEQLRRFDSIVDLLSRKNILPEEVHIANSEGLINFPESHHTMVRPGIILYGYATRKEIGGRRLMPVMSLMTKVSYFKVVPENTGISYNHTFVTPRMTRIVTLPIGYGDGYNRLLSNNGVVMIRGKKYPVVGNVCMDQIMVDIGPDGSAYNGDDVLLFGEDAQGALPLEEMCDKLRTIPYEVLCLVAPRVPRVYIG